MASYGPKIPGFLSILTEQLSTNHTMKLHRIPLPSNHEALRSDGKPDFPHDAEAGLPKIS